MSRPKREEHFIDVIERVLGGVQVTTGNERGSRAGDTDVNSRPRDDSVPTPPVEISQAREDEPPKRDGVTKPPVEIRQGREDEPSKRKGK